MEEGKGTAPARSRENREGDSGNEYILLCYFVMSAKYMGATDLESIVK